MKVVSGAYLAAVFHFAPRNGPAPRAADRGKLSLADAADQFKLDEAQKKRLDDLSESEKQLRQLVRSPAELKRENRGEKAGRIKQRLEMLLKQIPLMDARAAKAALAELKRLAAELRQLAADSTTGEPNTAVAHAENLGASAGGETAPPLPSTAGANPGADAANAQAERAGQDPKASGESATAEAAPVPVADPEPQPQRAGKIDDENEFRRKLEELRQLLKTVAALLKNRLRHLQGQYPASTAPAGCGAAGGPDPTLGAFIDIKA
ncbi:MAG: hypothetical protein HY850_07105 [Betaproteobacteria bacterium]|nr:hypothetical protein [Betaproteobacteria bacterium]